MTLCEFQNISGQSTKFQKFQGSAQAWLGAVVTNSKY